MGKDILMNLRDLRKEVERLVKYEDEPKIKVAIYNFPEDESDYGIEGWEIEVHVMDEIFGIEDYYNEAEAVKRAKAILRTIKGWNLAEVNNRIKHYGM